MRINDEPSVGPLARLKCREASKHLVTDRTPRCYCRSQAYSLNDQSHHECLDDVMFAVQTFDWLLNQSLPRPVLPRRPSDPGKLKEVSLPHNANTVRRCVHTPVQNYVQYR